MAISGPEQIPQQPKQADTKKRTCFLLSVRASVLRNLGFAVFWGQGALVRVKHIFSFGNVGHLVCKVIGRRVPRLSDFVPEPRTSPVWGKGRVWSVESKFHLKTLPGIRDLTLCPDLRMPWLMLLEIKNQLTHYYTGIHPGPHESSILSAPVPSPQNGSLGCKNRQMRLIYALWEVVSVDLGWVILLGRLKLSMPK